MVDENKTAIVASSTQLVEKAPDFMEADGQMGLETVTQKVKPSLMKLVQKATDADTIKEFGLGAVILTPDRVLILPPGANRARMVPLFHYTEYCKFAGIKLKGQEPYVADKTQVKDSELAQRALSKDVKRQYEDHPNYPNDEKARYRYCVCENFICVFVEEGFPTIPFILSFSRGQSGSGQKFINLLSMRKKVIFGNVFEIGVDPTLARNSQGDWYVWKITNPQAQSFVTDEASYNVFKSQHLLFKSLHEAGNLETTYDEEGVETVAASANTGETGAF